MKIKSLALWLISLVPLALLAVGLTYGAWQEYRAWTQVRQAVLTAATQAKSELQQSHARQALARKEAAADVYQMGLMELAIGDQARSYCLFPGVLHGPLVTREDADAWPEAPLVSMLMADAEPMIKKLDHLMKARENVHYGLVHDELLETSFRHSFYNGDLEKAQRALTLMAPLVVADLTQSHSSDLDRYNRLYYLFARSLEHDRWNAEQLRELADLILKPLGIPERLQASRRNQELLMLSSIIKAYGLNGIDPSKFKWNPAVDSVYVLDALETSRRPDGIITVNDLSKSISLLNRPPVIRRAGVFKISTQRQGETNFDAVRQRHHQSAFSFGGVENFRRLASVAVALKQFHIKHERWPESLDELLAEDENQGLTIVDVEGNPLRYSFGIAAAKTAFVQSSQFRDAMANTRPEIPSYLRKHRASLPDDWSWLLIR